MATQNIRCGPNCGNWPAKTADECTFCKAEFDDLSSNSSPIHLTPEEIDMQVSENQKPEWMKKPNSNFPWLTPEDALILLSENGFKLGQPFSIKDVVKAVTVGYDKGFSMGINKGCSNCQKKINKVNKVIEHQIMNMDEITAHVNKISGMLGIEVTKNK